MTDKWQQLVKLCAGDRQICNCRRAYYAMDGVAWQGGKEIHNRPYCKWGCSTNQLRAMDAVAERVLSGVPLDLPPEHR